MNEHRCRLFLPAWTRTPSDWSSSRGRVKRAKPRSYGKSSIASIDPTALLRDQARWREYIAGSAIEPNIERDVLAMQRVDKPALLKRLFELGTEYSGQILSYNKMLGRLQDAGNTTTLARYLDLLSHGGLIAGLSNHANHAHRRRGSSPKLNVIN